MEPASKKDLRTDPDRNNSARAIARKASVKQAVDAYVSLTPICQKLRQEGNSNASIARFLNSNGHRTRNGALFARATVCKILARASASALADS